MRPKAYLPDDDARRCWCAHWLGSGFATANERVQEKIRHIHRVLQTRLAEANLYLPALTATLPPHLLPLFTRSLPRVSHLLSVVVHIDKERVGLLPRHT